MAYYLSEFVGDGSELDSFRPPVTGQYGIIDLRGDTTVAAGRCLLWTPADLPTDPRYEKVADATVESIPRNIARRIENALGVSLTQFDTLQAIIAELLILHGSFTDPNRWNPLAVNRFGRHRIVLGGEVIYDAPAPVGTTVTDDFNRTDQAGLGSSAEGWSWVLSTTNTWQIVNNQASQTNAGNAWAWSDQVLASDDHYSHADIATEGERHGLIIRRHASDNTHYEVWQTSSVLRVYRLVTGTYTELTDVARFGSPFTTMRFEMDGSAWDVLFDGVSYTDGTDTGITGNVLAGMYGRNSSAHDTFEAGDLGAAFDPANLSASVLGSDVTLTWDV